VSQACNITDLVEEFSSWHFAHNQETCCRDRSRNRRTDPLGRSARGVVRPDWM